MPVLMHFRGWGEGTRWSTGHALSSTIDRSGSVNADLFIEPQNRSGRNESVETQSFGRKYRGFRWISLSGTAHHNENSSKKHHHRKEEVRDVEEALYSKFYLESSVETVGEYVSNSNKVRVQSKSIIHPENAHSGNDSNCFQRVRYTLDDERETQTHHSQNPIVSVIPPQPDYLVTKIAANAIDFSLLPSRSCLKQIVDTLIKEKNDAVQKRCNKRVSFCPKIRSTRCYNRVVGDHPHCKDGPPLSLGWEYYTEEFTEGSAVKDQIKTRGRCKPLNTAMRWEKLAGESGYYTRSELRREIRKNMRNGCCNRLSLADLCVLESEVVKNACQVQCCPNEQPHDNANGN